MQTTTDTVLGGRLALQQPERGPRAGLDAVFLAQAFAIEQGAVLDAGAGTGVVGLIVAQAAPAVQLTAVEVDADLAELIVANAAVNGLSDRVTVVNGDVLWPLRQLGLTPSSQDVVLCNPPFGTVGAGNVSKYSVRARAHAMPAGDLDRWARFWSAMARPGGLLGLIHRADCIGAILTALDGRFGGIEIFPLFPKEGAAAHRIVVRAVKGSRALPTLLPGLVLHNDDDQWTPATTAILAGNATLWER